MKVKPEISTEQVIAELQALQACGVTLPFSPEFIAEQEQNGHIVDLESGAIVLGAVAERYRPTAKGGA